MSFEKTLIRDFRIQQDWEARFKHLLPNRDSLQVAGLEGLTEQIRQQKLHSFEKTLGLDFRIHQTLEHLLPKHAFPHLTGLESLSEQLRKQQLHLLGFWHEEMRSQSASLGQFFDKQNEFIKEIERARESFVSSTVLETCERFRISVAHSTRELLGPIAGISEMVRRASEEIQRLFEPVRQTSSSLKLLAISDIQRFHEVLNAYNIDFWRQWDETEKKAFKIFARIGLTGLGAYLTRGELLRILELHKSEGRAGVLRFIFSRFRKNNYRLLNRLTRNWWQLPYMEKRKKFVRSALRAHKEGKYELVIPTLYPCIDGIAALLMAGVKGESTIRVKEVVQMHHDEEDTWATECIWNVVNMLLYRKVDFKQLKRLLSTANRHAVLHGRAIGYGTELNSYRVILMLDTMVNIALQKPQLALKAATP